MRSRLVGAGLCSIALGLAIGLPLLLSGDHDEYGRIDIPGEGAVDLPEGEVVVFYEEGRDLPDDESLPVPALRWRVRPPGGGAPLQLDGDGGREVAGRSGYSFTDLERLDVDRSGRHGVTATALSETGPKPTLTFGTSGVTAVALAIPVTGCVAGALLLLIGFLPRRAGG